MILPSKLKIQKKHKYFLQSLFVAVFLYLYTAGRLHLDVYTAGGLVVFIVLFGTFITQYPNIDLKNIFYTIINPLSLLSGSLLFFHFFPNLSFIIKMTALIFFAGFYYLVSLVDNIFLVVEDREESIPLYRAATAWAQIIQVVVAIPLFSGIFKIDTNCLVQNTMIGIISSLYVVYQLWVSRFDSDSKKSGIGESFLLSSMTFFLTFSIGTAISFIPTEAFLRALLISLVLMFSLTYISSYLKNDINNKMMTQFTFIFLLFLGIVIFFTP
ncbi:MAG TPA: hypothetical protein PKK07_00375 [bacterium]|nr:hypothetical protein [bacterium]